MAFGKGRANKRSSSSTSSTIATTIIFLVLCVLGLWLLTSNSVTTKNNNDHFSLTSQVVGKSRIDRKPTPPAFEDNPGDLPNKSDQQKQVSEPEIHSDDDSSIPNEEEQKSSEESASVLEESKETESEETPKGNETQSSEESSATQYQQDEQTETTDQDVRQPVNGIHQNNEDQESKNQDQFPSDKGVSETSHESDQEDSNQNSENQQEQENHDTQQIESEDSTNHLQNDDDQESKNQDQQYQNGSETAENLQESNQNDNETTENSLDSDEDSKQKIENQQQQEQENQVENTKTQQSQTSTEEEQKTKTEDTTTGDDKLSVSNTGDSFLGGENSGIPKESKESKKSWSTQADQSENEKERRKDGSTNGNDDSIYDYTWQLCNVTAGNDYIPCLDNEKFLSTYHKRKNHEHRERHCPEEAPTCLVSTPERYKRPIEWPRSRDKIWYHNVPHTKLAEVKGHQNWVKVTGEYLTFPGGGTQFIHGALHYIDFVQQSVPRIAWGKNTRVILDVGCGVASFGGYLFERGVLTMSFAPKDEHEAQVQFALERGIPAISAVMGSQRLPFPSRVFDLVHCARCRVPWHENGGALLLELNRVLRPGGHFVWSATPVYQKLKEDVEIWKAMSLLTSSMCWELVTIKKDNLNSVGAAIYRKPSTNDCYDQRKQNRPPMCKSDDDPNAAWYVPLEACMHRAPVGMKERGGKWPERLSARIQTPPYWLNSSQMEIYGKPAPLDFAKDYEHWLRYLCSYYKYDFESFA